MASRLVTVLSKILFDVLAILAVFIPWIVLHSVGHPYRRGFYCNDESIRYPYKDSTVKSSVLTVVGFVLAISFISITETVHHFYDHREEAFFQISENKYIPDFVVKIYKYFGVFLFGLAIQQTITNIGKFTIGRLRPHFIDVCKPAFKSLNCTSPGVAPDMFIYVDQYECHVETGRTASESRLSFPSGHSSFSTFCAIYLTLYLQSRVSWRRMTPLKHAIQVFLVYGAVYTCLSRITDHKHHPTDVLTGAFLGFFVAAVVAIHCTDLYNSKSLSNSQQGKDFSINNNINNNPSTNNNINNNYDYHNNDDVVVNLEEVPLLILQAPKSPKSIIYSTKTT